MLKPSDAPAGSTYLKTQSGPLSLDQLVRGDNNAAAEKQLLQASGFKGAFRSLFAGVALPAAITRAHLTVSFAIAFPSAGAARAAVPVVAALARRTNAATTATTTTGLPAGAVGIHGTLTSVPGSSYFYAWPSANTVRLLIDSGASGLVNQPASFALARQLAAQGPRKARYRPADLRGLVLGAANAPAGTQLNPRASGVKTVRNFATSPAGLSQLKRLGFRAGYGSEYVSPGLLKPRPSSQSHSGQGNYVLSEAQQFANPQDGLRAYRFFRQRELNLFRGHPIRMLSTGNLGSAATGIGYVDVKAGGSVYGYGYFWQRGPFLLAVFEVGSKDYATTSSVASLAQRMNLYSG
ncbi:MAG TPA: hypothetical protein VG295_08860 [Solirubrobacteraceae bacterium]|nr:hypothetical protein [Solirubrobacteraceae bacterium]